MANDAYVCCLFTIVLNEKHDYKNVFGIGRFHTQGIQTYTQNTTLYMKSVITGFQYYDDIEHIILLSTISDEKYKNFIEFYFTKHMRYYSIDVSRDNIVFSKPSGWYE